MTFLRLHLTYRNIQRLRQIISILMRHGFYPVIERIHLTRLISIPQRIAGRKATQEQEFISFAARTRLAFEELGPTFIKFGQILSTRPDLIPHEYIEEFKKLQDDVPPFSSEEAREVVEEELKKPINELLDEFDEKPLAAASIAQVNKAVLQDGSKVVLKIQRPNIRKNIEADIDILFNLGVC